ncbi:hypothetical protein AKO1_005218, partial [Acrasis kona]
MSLIESAEVLEHTTTPGLPYNIFLCCVGLGAGPHDFDKVSSVIEERFCDQNYLILKSKNHKHGKAHSGIDQLGIWFAEQVVSCLRCYDMQIRHVNNGQKHKVSILGHSIGGLVARYSLGLLFEENSTHEFVNVFNERYKQFIELRSFFSIVCPHLGTRRNVDGLFKFWWAAGSYVYLGAFGHTGTQLRLGDGRDHESNLLRIISEPGSCFMNALGQFKYRTLLAITHFDTNLSYVSGSIRAFNPYPEPKFGHPDFKLVGYSNFHTCYEKSFERHLRYESEQDVKVSVGEIIDYNNILQNKLTNRLVNDGGVISYGDDLQGTEFDLNPNVKKEPFMDSELQIMKDLQTLSWRRLDVQFIVNVGFQHSFIHLLPIGCTKNFKLGLKGLIRSGSRCVDLVVTTLQYDH